MGNNSVCEPGFSGPLPPEMIGSYSGTRSATVAGAAWMRSKVRVSVVVALAILVIAAPWAAPNAVGPGLTLLAVGLGVAAVFFGLSSPVLAVVLLLVTMFLRIPLQSLGLPVEPRMLAFVGVVGAAAVAVLRGASRVPKLGVVEAAMVIYVIWNIGSAITPHVYPIGDPRTGVADAAHTFILIGTVIPFTLYLVARFVFDREWTVRILLWTVIAFAGYSAAVSILQFHAPALVWPRYILESPPDTGWIGRASGVFNQPVVNGLIIVIGFAIVLVLTHQQRTPPWQRLILLLFAVASLYAIFLTHTRVVWLDFAIMLLLGAVLLPRSRISFVATILGVGFVIGVNWGTFTSTDRSVGGVGSPDELSDRLNMIATSVWAVQEQPLVGWGIGRFAHVNTYHHKQWSTDVEWRHGYGLSSHLNELGIAVELGLVGLVLWLAVLFLVGRRLFGAVSNLPHDGLCGRDLAVIALIAFIALIAAGLTVDLRFFDFANALVMLLVGTAVGYADQYSVEVRGQ